MTTKRTVEVTIVKTIVIELLPKLFGPMSQEEWLAEYNKFFGKTGEGLDDVIKHAAMVVATSGTGDYEALGKVGPYYCNDPSLLSIKFNEIGEEIDTEFVDGCAS